MVQASTNLVMNSALGKQVLSLIREGNYAHPGEEAAIDRVFSQIPQQSDRLLLDIGCGLGGTAAYIQNHGWGKVVGVDIDAGTIERAQQLYADIAFYNCDVLKLSDVFKDKADVIYLFNAFYAFPQQQQALDAMRSVAKTGATLLIFDYVLRGDYQDARVLIGQKSEIPHPIDVQALPEMLTNAGWQLSQIENLDAAYIAWYEPFMEKIQSKKKEIIKLIGAERFKFVHYLYGHLLSELRANRLGGGIIQAVAV